MKRSWFKWIILFFPIHDASSELRVLNLGNGLKDMVLKCPNPAAARNPSIWATEIKSGQGVDHFPPRRNERSCRLQAVTLKRESLVLIGNRLELLYLKNYFSIQIWFENKTQYKEDFLIRSNNWWARNLVGIGETEHIQSLEKSFAVIVITSWNWYIIIRTSCWLAWTQQENQQTSKKWWVVNTKSFFIFFFSLPLPLSIFLSP